MAEMGAGLLSLVKLSLLLVASTAPALRLARRLDPDERPVAAFALGLAGVSTIVTLLLLARLPAAAILSATLLGGLVWARREARDLVVGVLAWLRARVSPRRADLAWTALLAAFGALGLIGCWAPATGWDAGVYHFSLARLRAEEGWMVVRPDIPFSYLPAGMESLYTAGFLFDGERLASLFNFAIYFGGLGLTRLWAGRAAGEGARLPAGLAYLASGTYVLRLDGGDVEVGQALYLGLGLYALWRMREGGLAVGRLLAGAAFGFALAVKYSMAGALAAAGTVWVFVRWRDGRPTREMLGDLATIGIAAAMVAAPCYLRNLILAGNPVHPFLDSELEAVTASSGPGVAGLRGWLGALRLDALLLVVAPAAFGAAAARMRWLLAASLLFLLPILRHTGLSEPGLANAVRYGSPAFLPLWVLVGGALSYLLGRPGVRRWGAGLLLGGALAFSLALHGERNRRKIPVAIGLRSRDAYLEERINSYWAMRRAERELPEGKKVLLVEQRSYYCRAPFVEAADIQRFVDFGAVSSPSAFRALLDRHSIGLIVHSHAPEAKTRSFADLLARVPSALEDAGVEAVETRNACTLYRVR